MGLKGKLKVYEQEWRLTDIYPFDAEDLDFFQDNAVVVPSQYGKSFQLKLRHRKGVSYLVCAPQATVEIGREYPLRDILVEDLEKDGVEIQRGLLKTDTPHQF